MEMEEEATQPSTQLVMDPRRLGEEVSDLSEEDQGDILCIFHPTSNSAMLIAQRIGESAPEHTVSRADIPTRLRGDPGQQLVTPDTMTLAENGMVTRDLALRLSSTLKDPLAGYTFGRNPERCDFVFTYTNSDGAKRISNIHFRVWLTEAAHVIMLEDQSTNGTWVENKHLRAKNKENGGLYRHTLTHGTIIRLQMVPGQDDDIVFVVRIPSRESSPYYDVFDRNVAEYFDRMKQARDERERVRALQNGNAAPDLFANQNNALVTTSNSLTNRPREWRGGNKYNKGGVIGKGAFATVYMLTDKYDGTQYAAKEIEKRKFIKNGVLDQKIEQEMSIMADIRHDNIVRFIDHIDWADHLYIIMDYVPAGSLTSLIEELGPLEEIYAKDLASQMLDALKYLHGKGIAHRDIKPDNVLVQSRPPNLHVKLTDFGLSKRILPEEETFLRTFCGTILYCAPEVYPEYTQYFEDKPQEVRERAVNDRKAKRYDHMIDIWSLAGLIFYSLTTLPPYQADTSMTYHHMLKQIMTGPLDIRPLQQARVTEQCIAFLKSMLVNMPQLRATIAQLEADPWLTGEVVGGADSIETEDTQIVVRQPGESFHLDTQMTDVDALEDEDEVDESGLEQGASQLSIVEDPGEDDEDDPLDTSDEVDLVHDTGHNNRVGRIEIPDSVTSDSFFEDDSFDAVHPTGAAQPPQPRLFGEVGRNAPNPANLPLGELHHNNPRPPRLLRNDNKLMSDDSKVGGGGGDGSDSRGDTSLSASSANQPDSEFASATSSLVAEPARTFASSNALGLSGALYAGRAPSLLGAESMVGDMAINSPPPAPLDASSSNVVPAASLRRPREPDNDEDERPAAKRHHSTIVGNDESVVPASVFFDAHDKSTHHLNYPKLTETEYKGVVELAKSQGDSFERGGKLFDMIVGDHQRKTSDEPEFRAQSEPAGGNAENLARNDRSISQGREALPFGGKYGGWVDGVPTPEIAKFFPEFEHHYDNQHASSSQTAMGDVGGFQPPRRILAKLVSTPDSVVNVTITITDLLTTWGRGFKNTIRFEEGKEDRVPKNALKIILWAPGVKPGDPVPANSDNDFAFYIATKATHGIKVNNVPLQAHEPAEPQKAVAQYWGRLQHGDIVVAWCHLKNNKEIVKFRFDCFWGKSKEPRASGDFFDVVEEGPTRAALDRFCQWEESRVCKIRYDADLQEKQRKEEAAKENNGGLSVQAESAGTGLSAASSHTDAGGREDISRGGSDVN